jgi:hypothetical protein
MPELYQLSKKLWTDADFEVMSWHDCPIHAISFSKDHKLMFDIDYIFKWVLTKNKKRYQFWIAPCTLVFENVYNIQFESDHTTLIIDNVSRENPKTPKNAAYIDREVEFSWIIETTVGEIDFTSVGYRQYVRREPVLVNTQGLALPDRGGISFDERCS